MASDIFQIEMVPDEKRFMSAETKILSTKKPCRDSGTDAVSSCKSPTTNNLVRPRILRRGQEWARETVEQIKGIDFDFAESAAKFDKRKIFSDIKVFIC